MSLWDELESSCGEINEVQGNSDLIFTFDDDLEIIDINVSGESFQTYVSTLERFPETLLGDPMRRQEYFVHDSKHLFFDRHREAFESILHFYQSDGDLYVPEEISIESFIDELAFFDLSKSVIEKLELDNGLREPLEDIELPTNPGLRKMWIFLEYADSSSGAKVFAILSVIVIVISLALFVVETIPSVIKDEEAKSAFFIANTMVIIWFTIEFILRLITCPNKFKFFVEPGNVIDLLSILPYYLTLGSQGSDSRILSVIRVIRVMRVLKLSRHSSSLKVLGRALVAGREELAIVCCFIFIFVLLYGSLVYYAEESLPQTHFTSIPAAMWWAIVSLTSAGYGDMSPVTVFGRLIGSFATVLSILVCVLPVPSMVSHFVYFSEMEKNRQARSKKKEQEE